MISFISAISLGVLVFELFDLSQDLLRTSLSGVRQYAVDIVHIIQRANTFENSVNFEVITRCFSANSVRNFLPQCWDSHSSSVLEGIYAIHS